MSTPSVVVIGAGPAGLMAAGQAAKRGAQVLLLEKMGQPGRKLRLTGKGRCNLTNIQPMRAFIEHFNPDGRFLYSAFSRFFTQDLLAFFDTLGVATKVERGGRVFPLSENAQEIVDALVGWAQDLGVEIQTHSRVARLTTSGSRTTGVALGLPAGGKSEGDSSEVRIPAARVILATGGASYPGTGSTGDGYRMAAEIGHTIVPIRPALVPLETAGDIAPRLQGLSLRNVRVSLLVGGEEVHSALGEMLFTHYGISGPLILTLSRAAVDGLRAQRRVEISIDLKPALRTEELDARLLRDLDSLGTRRIHNILATLLPKRLIPICIQFTQISGNKQGSQITADERGRLLRWLKDFRLAISNHRGFSQAIITAGGADTAEVDPRTMHSQVVEGLYFAGEILDLDADTGGYNLQAAFSTGWLAGVSAGEGSPAAG